MFYVKQIGTLKNLDKAMKSPCDSLNPFLTTQCWWILILFSCHGLYMFCFLQLKIGNHSFIHGDSPGKDGSILKLGWEGTHWFFSKKECMLFNLCLHTKDFFRRVDAVCDLEIRALLLGDPSPKLASHNSDNQVQSSPVPMPVFFTHRNYPLVWEGSENQR